MAGGVGGGRGTCIMIGFRGAAGDLNPWLCLGPEGTHPTLYASVLDQVEVVFSLPLENEFVYGKTCPLFEWLFCFYAVQITVLTRWRMDFFGTEHKWADKF